MSAEIIWRYMSLAKYIELLRTKSLYFPKAALFDDKTEGKWLLHSFLIEEKVRLNMLKKNKQIIIEILEKANNDTNKLYSEVKKMLKKEKINQNLKDIFKSFSFYYICNRKKFKPKEYLDIFITEWTKQIKKFPEKKNKLISQAAIHRESTYISCWYSRKQMSLAMWQLFGGGKESIAIRTTIDKLKNLLDLNNKFLKDNGYKSNISKVNYIPNLKKSDKETRDQIMDILYHGKAANASQFSIKPKEYEYEKEVRVIIYPKIGVHDKLSDPDSDKNGFIIPIKSGLENFIDAIHIHPLQDKNTIINKVINEVNKLFNIEKIPIKVNTIEAFGEEINFQ